MPSLNCLFVVQGEGRGHMTQALALRGMLARAGHTVSCALVGRSVRREVPAYFLEKIEAPVVRFASPNFILDADDQAISLLATTLHNVRLARAFQESLRSIDLEIRRHRPDVVINFLDPLAGLYYRWHRPAVPMVGIGHHYMCHHPAFPFPAGHRLSRRAFQCFTDVTAYGAARRLALSFYPAAPVPGRRLVVVPPLLREALFRKPRQAQEPFLLVYLLNSGYAAEIIRWHERHPGVALHCFWDNPQAPAVTTRDATLTFHRLDDEKFLSLMARCSGLVSTAGFESVCEAMYLGKPVLMVPVGRHFEQQCNARDAVKAGAGIWSDRFEVERLLALQTRFKGPSPDFRRWIAQAEEHLLREIEAVARLHPVPHARTLAA